MKNNRVLILAGGVIAAGLLVLAVGILAGGRPGMRVGHDGVHLYGKEENDAWELEKTKLSDFTSADIEVEYADFQVIPSDGYYLEYRLPRSEEKPVYGVKNGTFSFGGKNRGFYLMKMDFDFLYEEEGDYFVNFYVPEGTELDEFDLKVESGDVELKNFQAERLGADVSYGDIFTEDILAKNAKIDVESGNVMISGGELGQVEIQNEYGNVEFSPADDISDYGLSLETEYGDIDVPEMDGISREDEMKYYKKKGADGKSVKISVESGNITVK